MTFNHINNQFLKNAHFLEILLSRSGNFTRKTQYFRFKVSQPRPVLDKGNFSRCFKAQIFHCECSPKLERPKYCIESCGSTSKEVYKNQNICILFKENSSI
jgi:hypothetical protein